MKEEWEKFWYRSAGLLIVMSISLYLQLRPVSAWILIGGAAYSLNPLDSIRKKEGNWKPLALGGTIYFLSLLLYLATILQRVNFYQKVL